MAEQRTVDFTLDDLKNPAYWWRIGNQQKNVFAIAYNINGKPYTFLPTDYIQKGFRDGNTQYVDKNFLDKNTLDTIFNEGIGVDLEGVAADWAVNGLKNTGFGTDGVLIPNSVLSTTKVMSGNNMSSPVNYRINSSRTGGAVQGLTEYNGQYVYAQAPQGDNTQASYVDAGGTRRATFLQRKGGLLGTIGGVLDDVLGIDPGGGGVFGSISSGLAQFEDIVRAGVEEIDAALQNPYVQAAIKTVAAVSPDPVTKLVAAGVDAYATVDSGEDLSAGQIANLAIAGNQVFGSTPTVGGDVGAGVEGGAAVEAGAGAGLDLGGATGLEMDADLALGDVFVNEVENIAKAGAALIDGADPVQVAIGSFGDKIAEGVTDAIGSVEGGEKVAEVLKDNPEISKTVLDVASGKEVSEAVADNFGDKIADKVGADTKNETALVKGGLETIVSLDEGKDLGDAAFDGANKAYKEGYRPDVDIDVSEGLDIDLDTSILGGLEDAAVAAGDFLAEAAGPAKEALIKAGDVIADVPVDVDPLDIAQKTSEGLAKISDVVSEGAAKAADVVSDSAAYLEDVISDAIPSTDLGLEGIGTTPDLGLNVPEISLDVPEIGMPEVAGPEFPDLPEVDLGIQKPTLDLLDFTGLLGGLRLGLTATEPKKTKPAGFIDDGQYLTQFDFLQNIEPLGTLGMLSGRNKT